MSKKKSVVAFPQLIHVTIDESGDEPYFLVNEDGVQSLDVNDQQVAIYKLAKVGRVGISKKFVDQD